MNKINERVVIQNYIYIFSIIEGAHEWWNLDEYWIDDGLTEVKLE